MDRGRTRAARSIVCLMLLGSGCHTDTSPGAPPTPPPTPSPVPGVVPIAHVGPLDVAFVSASAAPGSTISGCGPLIGGCADRLVIAYRVRSTQAGTALFARGFLYATNQIACLEGRLETFAIPAQQDVPVEIVFDQPDDCATPLTIRAMALNVEGTVEIATRQEWTISYLFLP